MTPSERDKAIEKLQKITWEITKYSRSFLWEGHGKTEKARRIDTNKIVNFLPLYCRKLTRNIDLMDIINLPKWLEMSHCHKERVINCQQALWPEDDVTSLRPLYTFV